MRWLMVRGEQRGRLVVQCLDCGNYYWPTLAELTAWTVCAHCVGWWTFQG